ncbi:MAG: hypothetical protein ACXVBE_16725 [Bdellovibrionota bacterium]
MKTRNLLVIVLTALVGASCASTPPSPPACAENRVQEARPEMQVCNDNHHYLPHEPFLERREQI